MKRLFRAFSFFAFVSSSLGAVSASAAMTPIDGGSRYDDGRYIISVAEGVDVRTVMADHGIFDSDSLLFTQVVNAFSAGLTAQEVSDIALDPRVIAVDENQVVRRDAVQTTGPTGTFNAPNAVMPWGLDRIDQRTAVVSNDASKQSYTYTRTGAGVKAYVLDSGIKADHPEFGNRVVAGWSYRAISQAKSAQFFNSMDSCKINDPQSGYYYNPNDHLVDVDVFDSTYTPNDVGWPDNDGHGTHVAGVIGGLTTGVAKGVTIVPVRVLNSCGQGDSETVLLGLQWIFSNHVDGEPAVANMSIGFSTRVPVIDEAITNLLEEGVVITAAAGNSNSNVCGTPAGTYGTISVAASDSNDSETSYTNFGDCVDLFAPGSRILSASFKDKIVNGVSSPDYLVQSGTSMASPHVAGVAAIALELHPEILLDEILKNQPIQTRLYNSQTSQYELTQRNFARPLWFAHWIGQRTSKDVIKYHDQSRTDQTQNRLLHVGGPTVVSGVNSIRSGNSATVSWLDVPESDGRYVAPDINDLSNIYRNMSFSDVTYTAVLQPGNLTCRTKSTSCTVEGLDPGIDYWATVRADNLFGISADSEKALATFVAPNLLSGKTGNRMVKIVWKAVAERVTYVVTETSTGRTCVTIKNSCNFAGLSNGRDYTFSIVTKTPSGVSSLSASTVAARPGFVVKKTTVAKQSKTLLNSLLTTPSQGTKTWSESGKCSIVRGRLVAPKVAATCKVTLRVAKAGKYPVMRTTVNVVVS